MPLLKLWRGNQGSVASVGRGADLQKKWGRTLISDQEKDDFPLKDFSGTSWRDSPASLWRAWRHHIRRRRRILRGGSSQDLELQYFLFHTLQKKS